jgi:hypothetical protein
MVSLGAASLLLAVATLTSPRLRAEPPKQPDAWGPERDGLRTRLLPAQEEYAVGRPATFRLEMKNVGQEKRTVDPQAVGVNGSMRISGPTGKPVRYVGGSFQTMGRSQPPIAPGQTVVLLESLDLSDQYPFVKPGTYTIQFRGTNVKWHSESEIPPSGTVTVKLRPGAVPASMQVPARLVDILPEGWDVSLNGRVAEVSNGKITPPGWESGPGTYVGLEASPHSSLKLDVARVGVWVADHRLAWTGKGRRGKAVKPGEAAAYLGKGVDGHVYWILPETAQTEWPEIRAKVRAALQIGPLAAEPAASK